MKLPDLDLGRRQPPREATVRAFRPAGPDPLSGHRSAGDSASLVAEAGPLLVIARLRREARGVVLRGQACGADPAAWFGALVHARGTGGAALAAVDERGEFVLGGWSGDLVALDVETEEGAWRIAWPDGRPA